MTSWEVAPGTARAGGGRVSAAGSEVGELAGPVAATLRTIAQSGGDPEVGRAGALAARRWLAALHRLGGGTAGLGTAVTAAVDGYEAADAAAAKAFGGDR